MGAICNTLPIPAGVFVPVFTVGMDKFLSPASIDQGYIVFGQSVCLSACFFAKTFTLAISFD